MLVTNLGINK